MHQHIVHLPNHSAEFRRCLIDCDVRGIVRLWAHVSPNMPLPENDEDALIVLHMTRTTTERIPFRFRAYSHRWLTERNIRSLLPEKLKPKAEQMFPRIVSAVGICVSGVGNKKTDYHHAVMKAMSDAVADLFASGVEEPVIVSARMKEVHDRLRKQK